uniref:hypothetical protein n=1 Tax=Pseudomonas machongensis TaxID=3110229 RepID=UPI00389A81FD
MFECIGQFLKVLGVVGGGDRQALPGEVCRFAQARSFRLRGVTLRSGVVALLQHMRELKPGHAGDKGHGQQSD